MKVTNFSNFLQFTNLNFSSLDYFNDSVNDTLNSKNLVDGHSFWQTAKVWVIGILFVTLISLCAVVGIVLLPCFNSRTYNRLLTYFIGLGIGSLSGSAIFHLLPQAFGLVDPNVDPNHTYIIKSWFAIFGIYLFFIVDKLLKVIMEYKKLLKTKRALADAGKLSELDSESQHTTHPSDKLNVTAAKNEKRCNGRVRHVSWSPHMNLDDYNIEIEASMSIINSHRNSQQGVALCGHDHGEQFKSTNGGGTSVIATVAWMIVFGDGLHNFIDGLSIGAAFSIDILSGISVSVAVLCEEFPHELGDMAILLASGMKLRQALLYNLLSAATCYIGFILGVLVGSVDEACSYIFALAGGMFLYISLGNMVPEMNKELDRAVEISIKRGLGVFLLQALGVLTGLLTMFIMAYYGSQIRFN